MGAQRYPAHLAARAVPDRPTLKRMVDHQIQNVLPFFTQIKGETHHLKRYAKTPNFLAIGWMATLAFFLIRRPASLRWKSIRYLWAKPCPWLKPFRSRLNGISYLKSAKVPQPL